MSYHDLSECTLTPDERMDEALRIVKILRRNTEPELMTDSEQTFVKFMESSTSYCSVKQLFWLRDIKDKYL